MSIKKLTKTSIAKKQYKQQQNRIKRLIKRLGERGYFFENEILPEEPKRITQASVRKLKKITAENLYKVAKYIDPETGEILGGVEGRKLERHRTALKSAQTRKRRKQPPKPLQLPKPPEFPHLPPDDFMVRVIISNWLALLRTCEKGEAYNLLLGWITQLRNDNGDEAVATMIEEGADSGNILTWDIIYHNDKARQYMSALMEHLPDQGVLYKDQMLDNEDYLRRLADAFEQNEDWELPK